MYNNTHTYIYMYVYMHTQTNITRYPSNDTNKHNITKRYKQQLYRVNTQTIVLC